MLRLLHHRPVTHTSTAEAEASRALDTQRRVRASLGGPDLLPTAAEDSCTWYGYLSIVLCRIPEPVEDRPGR